MCLIAVALDVHPSYSFVLAANRDEYLDRPAEPARWWPKQLNPESDTADRILAGRDLRGGGTWLGLTEKGRFAALTNRRKASPSLHASSAQETSAVQPSRGLLVLKALSQETGRVTAYLEQEAHRFNGFNPISGRLGMKNQAPELLFHHPQSGPTLLPKGIHALSNASMNTPWPKSEALGQAMQSTIDRGLTGVSLERALVEALSSQIVAEDSALPDTGVGLERERLLAPAFIRMPGYGTRVTTIVTVERENARLQWTEITWSAQHDTPTINASRHFDWYFP